MAQADSHSDYSYWTAPEGAFTVTYSLAAFHEIDFQVSEGFRRIPHGGIETGGLLFGSVGPNSAKIEAFRAIECEHASGPSFTLSERDVAQLHEQLLAAGSDPELAGLEVLGWFVAHTRTPLQMNEREAVLFKQLFPSPGSILLLVKPERYQPTRFGFIVRGLDGRVDPDAASKAIILPLPGRAGRTAEGPAPSIPAPVQRTPPPASPRAPLIQEPAPEIADPLPAEITPPPLPAAITPPAEAPAPSFWRDVPVSALREEPIVRIQEPLPPNDVEETKALTVVPKGGRIEALPSIEEIKRRRSGRAAPLDEVERRAGRQRVTRKMRGGRSHSSVQLISLLLLAALLGCGVGYLSYLQLPSATIPLTIRRQRSSLWVSWPAEQTRDAISATIRVNDGVASPLSAQQGAAGEAVIAARTDTVKIELTSHHALRDSRGIVRYVRGNSAPGFP